MKELHAPPWRALALAVLVVLLLGCATRWAHNVAAAVPGAGELSYVQGAGNPGSHGARGQRPAIVDPPPVPSAGDELADILIGWGHWGIYLGCAAVFIGGIAAALGWVSVFFKAFRPLAVDVLVGGVAAVVLGSAGVWLGHHVWVLGLVALAVIALLIAYKRKPLMRLWGKLRRGAS